jgi:hypothetical protein
LLAKGRVQIDEDATLGGSLDVDGRRATGGVKRRDDVVPDLVTATQNRRPEGDDELVGGNAFRRESGHGVPPDSCGRAAPTGVQGRHRGCAAINDEDRHAVSGPHHGNRAPRPVPSDADHAVGRWWDRQRLRSRNDDATVHLSKDCRLSGPESRGPKERGVSGPQLVKVGPR